MTRLAFGFSVVVFVVLLGVIIYQERRYRKFRSQNRIGNL